MGDYLIRVLPKKLNFRAFGVCLPEAVDEARRLQNLSPVATAALGRALAGVALLSADLKFGKVFMQIKGDGPLKEILAEANHEGHLRGMVRNPQVDLPPKNKKLPVGLAVGQKGFINIIRDYGLKEPYQGSIALVSGEIAEDLAYYLTVSEQVPSACALGVLVDVDGKVLQAGGYLIQKLPEATEEEISYLEEKLKNYPPLTTQLQAGKSIEEILTELLGEIEILEKRALYYKCTCSLERVEETLLALGEKELTEVLAEGKPLTVTCNFCQKAYEVPIERVKELLKYLREKGHA